MSSLWFQTKAILRSGFQWSVWLLIPVLVVSMIWLPAIRYYHIEDPRTTSLDVARARWDPSQSALREIHGDRLLWHGWGRRDAIAAAESLLKGELRLRGHPRLEYRFPFHPENLKVGPSLTRLHVAGLVPVDLFLSAFEASADERFLSAALTELLEFSRYEERALLPKGFLWNDHAVANRVFVLSDFWAAYRQHRHFTPRAAVAILELAGRSGELLSKPAQFAFMSNHGIMQNIALLRLSLSFPSLPKAAYYSRLARTRLLEQLAYYVSPEGVVLEHSAGYQNFGIELLRLAIRYTQLLGAEVPEEFEHKYTQALEFAGLLRRPDGTVPVYGDTQWGTRSGHNATARPTRPVGWYLVSGYAIWWDGLPQWPNTRYLRQTVLVFSNFPGHAHKHADDLSIILWAGGQTWWTNVGYWPFDRKERTEAVSWGGSSAPHLTGEPTESGRVVQPIYHGASAVAVALEGVRKGPNGYSVRRQVVHVKPNHWLTIDAVAGAPSSTSTTRWRTSRGVTLRDLGDGAYVLSTQSTPARLWASYFGGPSTEIRTLSGTLGPFQGLGANSGNVMVPAVEVIQPGHDSWSATAWVFDEKGTMTTRPQPRMMAWRGPEDWSALLVDGPTPLSVTRQGPRIEINMGNGARGAVFLERVRPSPQRQEIDRAFQHAVDKYPRFRERFRFRQWATIGLFLVIAVQEPLVIAVIRWRRGLYRRLRFLVTVLWVVGGVSVVLALARIP